MILGFKTQINGKPTYFVEKIFKGIKKALNDETYYKIAYSIPLGEMLKPYKLDVDIYHEVYPKIHTIREDKKDRWKPGVMIDFFINTRTKDMFRFAPRIPVVSDQKIEIIHGEFLNGFTIIVDGKILNIEQQSQLSHNDGFENLYEFICYFKEDFTGKLIHWTDKKY
jgi:hypothetical protein